jgi:hypothetical protein
VGDKQKESFLHFCNCWFRKYHLHTPLSASWLILEIQLSVMEYDNGNQNIFISNDTHLQLTLYNKKNIKKKCARNFV